MSIFNWWQAKPLDRYTGKYAEQMIKTQAENERLKQDLIKSNETAEYLRKVYNETCKELGKVQRDLTCQIQYKDTLIVQLKATLKEVLELNAHLLSIKRIRGGK